MAVDTKVLETIQKLLNRKNHPTANENEAAVCAEKIQVLLLEHGISLGQVQEHEFTQKGKETKRVQHKDINMRVKRGESFVWCVTLGQAVAESTMCSLLYSSYARSLTFVGQPTNVAAAEELYAFLVEQMENLCHQEVFGITPFHNPAEGYREVILGGRKCWVPDAWRYWHTRNPAHQGTHSIRFYRSFFAGCSSRIAERLRQSNTKTRREMDKALNGQVTALVRVTEAMVQDYIKEEFGKLTTRKLQNTGLVEEAYAAGRQAGNQVKLEKDKTKSLPGA